MQSDTLASPPQQDAAPPRGDLADYLWMQLGAAGHDLSRLGRVRGLLDVWAGRRAASCRPFQQAKNDVFMPDLDDDVPWLDTGLFAVSALMQARYAELREEVAKLQSQDLLTPYGVGAGGDALDVHPQGWKMFQLTRNSEQDPVASGIAPVAAEIAACALEQHAYVSQVAYLELGPGESLSEHVDYANFLVSCHVGLVVPGDCGLRVAGEDRPWAEGACMAFNNSYLHSAYNRSDRVRVVLAVHALHPSLTVAERHALRDALRTFGM